MRIEFKAAGVELLFDLGKRALARAEMELGMSAREIQSMLGKSEIVTNEVFGQAITFPSGSPLPEDEMARLFAEDGPAFLAVIEKISAAGNAQAVKAPSPLNTKNGALLTSTAKPIGVSKTGKSTRRSKAQ